MARRLRNRLVRCVLVGGAAESEQTTVDVRGMILWRKGGDGVWRVSMAHIG